MTNYQEAIVKVTNTQLKKTNKKKIKKKNKEGSNIKIKLKNEELRHELFLTTRQTSKLRNAFANNMSTHMKQLTQISQITEIIQSGECLHKMLGTLGKKSNDRSC